MFFIQAHSQFATDFKMKKFFLILFVVCLIVGCTTKNPVITEFGSIFVSSDVPGAEIFLDNVSTGKITPDTIFSVPAGSHQITLKKSGYTSSPNSVIVSVSANKTKAVFFTLNQLCLTCMASLDVGTNIRDCFIVLDNQPTGFLTPYFFDEAIIPGKHIVSVFMPGYANNEPSKQVLNAEPLGYYSLFFTLSPGVVKKDSIGGLAPDFDLKDDYNNNVQFYCFRGFVSIINFWAEDCYYCLQELPYLEEIYKDYSSDSLKVFGINYKDNLSIIQKIRSEKSLSFDLLVGKNSQALIDYAIPSGWKVTPVTLIVDRSGKIAYIAVGFIKGTTPVEMRNTLNQLLGK
jgi:peroxiredoxin